jgi:serine/threonine-protein kinase
LKPSNIIINRDNVAKIMDFGISKSIFEKGITNTGTNIGTLYYMSPEQIKGEDITLQSDIYSIGITLYEMLSGAVPFDYQNEYQVIEGHLKESAPELLGKVPGLPLTIQKIIEKAISKKPQSRFTDCKDFYDELIKLESEMGKYNRPRVEKVDRSSKSYKAKAAVYTVLVVIAGLTLVYFSFYQVDGLWKSGINPFFKMKKNPESEQQISSTSKIKWKVLASGVKNNLNSIFFINDSTGFCCGSEGTLLFTTKSGAEWKKIPSPTERELVSICFNKPESGFLIDEYTVYRTRDYGKSWEKVEVDCSGKKLYKVKFIDKLNGFIIGSNGLILKTVDGGESWRQIESGTNNLLCDIVMNSNNGYCVGWSGEIIKTTDAGEHWKRLSPLTTNYLRRIKFSDRGNGFIIGGGGEIFKTTDAGASWAKVENGTSFALYDLEYIDEKICLIVGGQGKALLSTDRGNSWNAAETNNFARLNEIFVTPQNTLFAVGANGTIVKL